MKLVSDCVEQIKLAQFARTPIVWIVVREKEVADQIAAEFMKQHFGGRTVIGNSYQLKSLRGISAETLSAPKAPAVYFDWICSESTNEPSKLDVRSALELFLDFVLNIEFEETSRCEIDVRKCSNEDICWTRNLAIIASPETPDLGWINSYIETIYVSSLIDDEIRYIIESFSAENNIVLEKAFLDQLVVNFRGVSERQIYSVLLKCLASEYFDENSNSKILSEVRELKKQMLEGFNGLRWINVNPDGPKVAGLDAITEWLSERQPIFSDPEKSIQEGFDIPNGLLVTGIPGTGKSLMAKQAAVILDLPLIAMDLGDIQEGVVGKSEEHMAKALRMVDALAPCVLWIDEIEKAFSGSESGQSDGGVMRRMFGKFLTWMQEKESYCFVLATSNDITKLPPELFRSQRFDEKYYTFMPSSKECSQMFVANIKLQNNRITNPKGHKTYIFDKTIFENESYWLNILNMVCVGNIDSEGNLTEESVQLDKKGKWLAGYLPQKKLFTGADIASFVNLLKFRILSQRKNENSKNYGYTGPIKKIEADTFLLSVLSDFIPYGQSNLKDIALCFRSLTKNRFKSASATSDNQAIVRFSDYDELNERMKYDPHRFLGADSRYDRALYMCIVGAINGLPKENPQSQVMNEEDNNHDEMWSDRNRNPIYFTGHETKR